MGHQLPKSFTIGREVFKDEYGYTNIFHKLFMFMRTFIFERRSSAASFLLAKMPTMSLQKKKMARDAMELRTDVISGGVISSPHLCLAVRNFMRPMPFFLTDCDSILHFN